MSGNFPSAFSRTTVLLLIAVTMVAALPVTTNDDMMDNMDVTISVGNSLVSLNLTRNEHISTVPIYMANDEGLQRMPEQADGEQYAAYIDEVKNAAVAVRVTEDGKKEYIGYFNDGEHDYVIEPRASPIQSRRRKRDIEVVVSSDQLGDSELFETTVPEMDFDDDDERMERLGGAFMSGEEGEPQSDDAPSVAQDSGFTGGYRSFGVKMLIVVDYKIYRRWRELTSYNDAIFGIRHYFTHVANGIDLRYRSIRESNFGIYVKLAGIIIAETTGASYWTMKRGIREADTYTQGYKALEEFEGWVADESVRRYLPTFDQATLFTGNQLFRHRDDGSRRPFSGLAAYNSICRFKAPYGTASINMDGGIYASIQTGAHELGHNLGARHDSSNTNGCDSSDQFVMAVSPGSLHDGNFQNTFTFSRCSIRNFRDFLLYDLPDADNCLLDRARHESSSEVDNTLRKLPGTLFDADHQCQLLYGVRSFYCGGGDSDEMICHRMYCFNPEDDDCEVHIEQRAYDGTTCGNRKWCDDGECVYNRRAPATEDSCIYGDYKGIIRYVDLTCPQMVKAEPSRCYDERYNLQCCESCENIKNDRLPGCPYGDRRPDYCADMKRGECYEPYAMENCCETCENFKTNIEGCDYGDRTSWCRDVKMSDCAYAATEARCCEACPKLRTAIRGCPYGDAASWCSSYVREPRDCERTSTADICCGTCNTITQRTETSVEDPESDEEEDEDEECEDHASWCSTLFAGKCYKERTRQTCCKTCKRMETNDKGCQFGDKYSWCKQKYCDREGEACCATCQ